ncbi:MAG: hypothetical protein ABI207_02735 [Crocinitomicaceae bacterium]
MIAKKNTDILAKIVSLENHVSVFFRKHGIFHIQVEDNAVYNLHSYKFVQEFRLNNPQFNADIGIFEFGSFSSVDNEARELASQREISIYIGEAYITTNLAQRLLVKHYMRILRAKGINVQMFDDYESAKTWLLSLKRKA